MIWPLVRLESIIADTRNGLYKHADFYGRGTPILKMFNLQRGQLDLDRVDRVELEPEELSAYRLKPGDVLMNRVNTPELVGKCAVISAELGEAVFESKNIRIRFREDLADSRFVASYLNSPLGHPSLCRGMKHAIGMATINNGDLRNCSVPLPALKEQRRIVVLLEQADGLRRQRAEADALVERILPALFHRMFGNPANNPKGWVTTTLVQTTEITTGNTPSREDPENFGGKMPWARPADLETALPLLHTAENISEKGSLVARIVPAGSVLVCCIGATLGKVGLAGTEVAINQQINALLPSAKATPEFLYSFCLLNARSFMAAATQATLPILNKSRFGQQPIILPPLDRQRKFSELAQAIIRQRPAQEQARQNLERIFATMLHRAFTGELTAKWREAHLKELLAEMEQQARLLKSPLVE